MQHVVAKKRFGQHFLKNEGIANKISESIDIQSIKNPLTKVLEIGPGTGILTKQLIKRKDIDLYLIEVDNQSVAYLEENYKEMMPHLFHEDFLKFDITKMGNEPWIIVGNFPYNISTEILFRVLENKDLIPQLVGMFQKEVGERVAAPPGSKTYGIVSVLIQAYFDVEYLFTVEPNEFVPPPKVRSGVIRLKRNENKQLKIDYKTFSRIVKLAFNQRRKTLRNSLKSLINNTISDQKIFDLRPEQLSVEAFEHLALQISQIPNNIKILNKDE